MIKVIWPERISLNYWAACLVSDFHSEGLPKLENDEDWQEWGTIVAGTGVFAKASIPAPLAVKEGVKTEVFTEWNKWAKVVYTILSDEYNSPKLSTLR